MIIQGLIKWMWIVGNVSLASLTPALLYSQASDVFNEGNLLFGWFGIVIMLCMTIAMGFGLNTLVEIWEESRININ